MGTLHSTRHEDLPKTTAEFLARIKFEHGIESDYGLAQYLDATPQVISNYKKRKSLPDEVMAKRIAQELGLEPGYVFAMVAAERCDRANRTELADTWRDIAKKHGIIAAFLVGFGLFPAPDYSLIHTAQAAEQVYTLYAAALILWLVGALWRPARLPTPHPAA